jgi:hypothetical protein
MRLSNTLERPHSGVECYFLMTVNICRIRRNLPDNFWVETIKTFNVIRCVVLEDTTTSSVFDVYFVQRKPNKRHKLLETPVLEGIRMVEGRPSQMLVSYPCSLG